MQSAAVIRIEKTLDRMASALFASACGFAAKLWFAGELDTPVLWPVLWAATAAAAALAYLLSTRALGSVRPEAPRLRVPIFHVSEVEPMDQQEAFPEDLREPQGPAELLLTDRAEDRPRAGEEPLLLDDILAGLEPNSRVVRLFDPSAMPAHKEPGSSTGGPFETEASKAQTRDAAKALHDALDELRRSLR